MEGGADFVAYLVTDRNINARLRDYALPREHALWTEFQTDMGGPM
jgi:hypothetical protein